MMKDTIRGKIFIGNGRQRYKVKQKVRERKTDSNKKRKK